MPRKFFRKYLPSAASVRENRWVALFGSCCITRTCGT